MLQAEALCEDAEESQYLAVTDGQSRRYLFTATSEVTTHLYVLPRRH